MIDRTKCTACGKIKTEDNTSRDRSRPDGLCTRCKDCQKKVRDGGNLPAVVEQKPRCGLVELVPDDKPLIYCRGDHLFTTSLDVARNFGKEHKNVLRDIDDIISNSPEEDRLNFEPIFVPDSYGRQQRAYEITRSGFSVLVMGFNGADALAWKWKYEKAFCAMEQKLIHHSSNVIATAEVMNEVLKGVQRNQETLTGLVAGIGQGHIELKEEVKCLQRGLFGVQREVRRITFEYDARRKDLTRKTKTVHLCVLQKYHNGLCPICRKSNLIAESLKTSICEFDHWYGNHRNKITETWPLCVNCHDLLTSEAIARESVSDIFKSYQRDVQHYLGNTGQLVMFDGFVSKNPKRDR
jgi:Rha family phage regulatory protein